MTEIEVQQLQELVVFVMNAGMACGVLLGVFIGLHIPGLAWLLQYRAWPRLRRFWKWRSKGVKPAPKG